MPQTFYQRDTVTVAQDLLGKIIIRQWNNQLLAGIITETEAYTGSDDPASHCYKGLTPRNFPMFGPVGYTYVYFIYGNHYCLNIVARTKDQKAGGVLIRSIVPLLGKEHMQLLRKNTSAMHLTDGPGKVCQALAVTQEHTNHDVTTVSSLYIAQGPPVDPCDILQTPRIGISKAQDKLWRFVLKKSNNNGLSS